MCQQALGTRGRRERASPEWSGWVHSFIDEILARFPTLLPGPFLPKFPPTRTHTPQIQP